MKVGVLTTSISRRSGGLFSSVRGLAGAVRQVGAAVEVSAVEDAWTSVDRHAWDGVPVKIYRPVGPRSFCYAPGLVDGLVASGCDLLHSHGLWTFFSIAAERWSRKTGGPYVVSPRGMLDSWALQNSRWKKRVAWGIYEQSHLRNSACIHALCAAEARAIRSLGLMNPICVIPNGVSIPAELAQGRRPWSADVPTAARVLLYLGRLHPKKNLGALVESFALAVTRARIPDWHLVIAGWDQGGYEAGLKAITHRRGVQARVHFAGPLFAEDKDAALRSAAAFVLPSHSEGLPMAVLEAWSYRLPVLMTDDCNLPEGFRAGAAERLPNDIESMTESLSEALSRPPEILCEMGSRGRALVELDFAWPRIAADMLSVYDWILRGGERPACVSAA